MHRRVASKQGGKFTVGGSYLWDVALLLEGCTSENEIRVDWDYHSNSVVNMSKTIVYFLRHSSEVTYDSEGFVCLSELMTVNKQSLKQSLDSSETTHCCLHQSQDPFPVLVSSLPRVWYQPQAICHARHWYSCGSGTLYP